VKQGPDSTDCLAVVAAMITKKPLSDFKSQYKPDSTGCYSEKQLCDYLLHNGWGRVMGVGFHPENYKIAGKNPKMLAEIKIKGQPAYVVVKSERLKEGLHAIYWDGKCVYDPNPLTKDGRKLSTYKILSWFPIQKLEQSEMRKLVKGKVKESKK